jgi:hypothetical protein
MCLRQRNHGPPAHPRRRKGSCSATTVDGSTALPFVIPTGAQRKGPAVRRLLLGNVFRPRNHGPPAHPRRRKAAPVQRRLSMEAPPSPFVISTEAQRSGEISVWMLLLGNVFRQRNHGPPAHPRRRKTAPVQRRLSMKAPPSPLSSRPKRSAVERSLCGCSFLEMSTEHTRNSHPAADKDPYMRHLSLGPRSCYK